MPKNFVSRDNAEGLMRGVAKKIPQKSVLPTATVETLGLIYQYIGASVGETLVNGYFYKCVENTSTTPSTYEWQSIAVQPGGGSGATINDNVISTASTWSSQKITNAIAAGTPVMQGASSIADGAAGFAPAPTTADTQKALFGDGQYHTVYTSEAGSTITVQTAESDLYGRTVTLTLGTATRTATISNSGEAVFTDVSYYGTAIVSADDGNGNEARGSVNLSYFGNYVVGLGFNFSTIKWETTNASLAGKQLSVYIGNREVGTVTLALVSGTSTYRATMYVETLATYKINTMTNVGRARGTAVVSALKQTITANVDTGEIYSFKIAKNDSNPATCVTPYTDCEYGCDNAAFTAAHMDFTNDVFNYGSLTGQEFFWPKPCMLGYDGVVDYYLNPDNYNLRADGVTASDVADMSYPGNVMIEFPTIYFKRWEDSDYHYRVISDKQLDNTFHAWAHHDVNGDVLPYIYLAAYNGSYDGTRMRSMSGLGYNASLATDKIMCQTTRQQEINFAQANNDANEQGEGWYIRHKADHDMINDLLLLIGMSTNTQVTFGRGNDSRGTNGCIGTGTMDDKGLFWGSNNGTSGVKVFGIENWWANMWEAITGWINYNGTQKIKMTYGQEDGSTVDGFNLDGTGYVSISNSTPAGASGGYISTYYTTDYGLIPKNASGSGSTWLADTMYFNNAQIAFVRVGGYSDYGAGPCGAFCTTLFDPASHAGWGFGASLSYKGLAS